MACRECRTQQACCLFSEACSPSRGLAEMTTNGVLAQQEHSDPILALIAGGVQFLLELKRFLTLQRTACERSWSRLPGGWARLPGIEARAPLNFWWIRTLPSSISWKSTPASRSVFTASLPQLLSSPCVKYGSLLLSHNLLHPGLRRHSVGRLTWSRHAPAHMGTDQIFP